jgi:hypothetical protein
VEKYEFAKIHTFAMSKNYIFELINGPSMIFIVQNNYPKIMELFVYALYA